MTWVMGWGVSAHIGHQKVENSIDAGGLYNASYSDWNVGVTKDVGFGVVGLKYSDTNAKGSLHIYSRFRILLARQLQQFCWHLVWPKECRQWRNCPDLPENVFNFVFVPVDGCLHRQEPILILIRGNRNETGYRHHQAVQA